MNYENLPDFSKVFEAWDQKPYTNEKSWTFVPAVGTHPIVNGYDSGFNSHFTYNPQGELDHYSVYNGGVKIGESKF